MAQTKEKYVTLYAPGGTQVEVNEARGEVLKERGYTTKAPRIAPAASRKSRSTGDTGTDQSAEIAELQAKLAAAEKERDDALQAATTPTK